MMNLMDLDDNVIMNLMNQNDKVTSILLVKVSISQERLGDQDKNDWWPLIVQSIFSQQWIFN